tara:strand:- start:604 stop:846 length:243 start_codon:yes stop_codon:yes gene_type:complete
MTKKKGDKMRYIRMNQICLDLTEVESIEWKKIDAEDKELVEQEMFSVRLHMKSGKMFTRQIFGNQFKVVKEHYKELLGDE